MEHHAPLPHQIPPTPSRPPVVQRLLNPFAQFLSSSTSGGILILLATLAALVLANGPLRAAWDALLHAKIGLRLGEIALETSLTHLINDGFMAVFFLLIGLEIKRELLLGELASPRKASLPIAAAIGGMLVPAAIYASMNAGGPGAPGWGIPMATDIAFALGILRLAGGRPHAAVVLLAALAIVDDLGAILVIALFYTRSIDAGALAAAAATFLALLAINRIGVRHPLPYIIGGLTLWGAVLGSGIHATIAGVLLAFCIPIRGAIDPDRTIAWTADFARAELLTPNSDETIELLGDGIGRGRSPLVAWEHALAPWVNFLIVPIFALANAGVIFDGAMFQALREPIFWGVLLGLAIGKPLGVFGASWIAIRLGLSELPAGMDRRALFAVGVLAGVGFTMAIFIAKLAFDGPAPVAVAKAAILGASLLAGCVGYALCRSLGKGARSV